MATRSHNKAAVAALIAQAAQHMNEFPVEQQALLLSMKDRREQKIEDARLKREKKNQRRLEKRIC